MKKKIFLCMILVMVWCMAGCSTQLEKELLGGMKSVVEQFETEQSEVEKSGTEPFREEQPEILQDVETEHVDYLEVTLEKSWDSYTGDIFFMYANYDSIFLETTAYPELKKTVDEFSKAHITETQRYINDIKGYAQSDYEDTGAEGFMGPYVYEAKMFVKRADDEVLAIEELVSSYTGGAHGYSYYVTNNFDVRTGEQISLEKVIIDQDSLPEILETEISEKYPDLAAWQGSLSTILGDYVARTDGEYQPEFTWTLGYDGVTFYFSNYEIGSYADGLQQVTVCYSEYPQIFEGSYFENVDEDYVIAYDNIWSGADTDLNDDGVTDYISVTRNYNGDMDFSESYDVTVNGNTFTQEIYCYDLDTYLVRSGECNYLYVQRTVENDYQSVCVFQITENSVEYMGEFSGGMVSFTNSSDFKIAKRMDLLSTFFALADCSVGSDGMPVEKDGIYKVQNEISIVSTTELTADLLDENGEFIGESSTFPSGTKFQFAVTDGNTFVDMITSDGQRCRLYVQDEWPPKVNGMNAEECFEALWYAG